MESLLAWHNLIFHIPIATSLLMLLGLAWGAGLDDGHAEADADADADPDTEADTDADAVHALDVASLVQRTRWRVANALGVGRVPLTLVVMTGGLLFGSTGLLANALLAPVLGAPGVFGPISVAVATCASALLTGQVARLVGRVMPTSETYRVTRGDLVGRSGTLVLPAGPSSGLAQVRDHEGNLHQIRCRTNGEELPKGGEVLVIDHDVKSNTYAVAELPPDVSSRS
ncbi:MAG: hypothetical protein AB2A00_17425 [Myxococcota bacterium]